MPVVVYHYPGCSTCKKALAWLRAKDVAFTAIDLVATPPSEATLQRAHKLCGAPVKRMFNVSGESYRLGGWKDRVATITSASAYAALAADGKLIKRPLVLGDNFALVGFDETAWTAAFG